MQELHCVLTPIEIMTGVGGTVKGLQFIVKLEEGTEILPNSDMIIKLRFQLNEKPKWYQIVQKIVYEPSSSVVEQLIPLEGNLWIFEQEEEIRVSDYTVDIYYAQVE